VRQPENIATACSRSFGSVCRSLLLLMLALGCCAPAQALDPQRTMRQLHHTSWTSKDGAPGEIFTMAQSRDGFLWLGTPTGLFRFDGDRFESFQSIGNQRLPSNDIYCLLPTPDGGLWIGYGFHGISHWHDGQLDSYASEQGFPQGTIGGLARDADGGIWAATYKSLLRFDGQHWTTPESWQFPSGGAQSVFVDRSGRVWAASRNRILYLPKGADRFVATGISVGTVAQFAEAADGSIWIAESSNAVRPVWVPDGDRKQLDTAIRVGANALLFDHDNGLWIASLGDGLRRSAVPASIAGKSIAEFGKEADQYTEAQGLSADFIYSVLQDREGNIWTGSSRGLDRFRSAPVVPVPLPSGYQALEMLPGKQSEVWIGSASRPLARIHDGSDVLGTSLRYGNTAGYRDERGDFWWSAEPWLMHVSDKGSDRIRLPDTIADSQLTWITMDKAQRLWIAIARSGVYVRDKGQWSAVPRDAGLPGVTPRAEFTDESGRMWMGYPGSRLAEFDGSKARIYSTADGLAVGDVKVIGGRQQRLWVGGEDGLALLHDGRIHSLLAAEATPFRNVVGVVEADDGSLWLADSDGIARIDAAELQRAQTQQRTVVAYRRFDYLDGLPGAIQQGSVHPAAIRADDGHLWFATATGLAWVDPARLDRNPHAPASAIRSISADSQIYAPAQGLKFAALTRELLIDYTAPSLRIPERIRFRYRLSGYDSQWQDAGNRRQAYYSHLAPGVYRFEVMAANEDGIWSTEPATLSFSIAPAFYQTWWFLCLCAALVLAAMSSFYLMHLRHVTRRLKLLHRERLIERERIARELHDTLLQSVQGLILRFQAAVLNLSESDPSRGALLETLVRANQTLGEGRDRVKGLRAGIASRDLAESLGELALELAEDAASDFSIRVDGTVQPMPSMVSEEVFKIATEALRNAFQHSGARHIEASLLYGASDFRLQLRDDGCGIARDVLKRGRDGHWGLSGMRERAFRIHGRLTLSSDADIGTLVELSIPASRAYLNAGPSFFWRLFSNKAAE
jgi:signal transduction histidine kinase/ligand-binding sensor domain-containing protein